MLRRRSGWVLGLLAFMLALLASGAARATEPPARVSVLTMGPGDHPFTRFGHNAILLEWEGEAPDRGRVYNFGTFAFDGLNGVSDFMTGRFRYWLSVTSLGATRRAYGLAKRSLVAQELELTAGERAMLFSALEDNARPEHRYYDYDYYADNCSTRVRDVLDQLLGGKLARSVHGPRRFSYRQHTLRLVGDAPLLHFGLDVALGRPTDRPISRWEELFLPQELHDELANQQRDLDGRQVSLVRAERRLLDAQRPALAGQPPTRAPLYGLLGCVVGGVLASLGRLGARMRAARVLFGIVGTSLGTGLGLLGLALAVFSLSKHSAAHWNVSLLGVPPWGLMIAWTSFSCARRGKVSDRRLTFWLSLSVAASLALLLLSLSAQGRESLRMAALFLPVWLGWLLGARQPSRTVI
jgi:hypothetical protein